MLTAPTKKENPCNTQASQTSGSSRANAVTLASGLSAWLGGVAFSIGFGIYAPVWVAGAATVLSLALPGSGPGPAPLTAAWALTSRATALRHAVSHAKLNAPSACRTVCSVCAVHGDHDPLPVGQASRDGTRAASQRLARDSLGRRRRSSGLTGLPTPVTGTASMISTRLGRRWARGRGPSPTPAVPFRWRRRPRQA